MLCYKSAVQVCLSMVENATCSVISDKPSMLKYFLNILEEINEDNSMICLEKYFNSSCSQVLPT